MIQIVTHLCKNMDKNHWAIISCSRKRDSCLYELGPRLVLLFCYNSLRSFGERGWGGFVHWDTRALVRSDEEVLHTAGIPVDSKVFSGVEFRDLFVLIKFFHVFVDLLVIRWTIKVVTVMLTALKENIKTWHPDQASLKIWYDNTSTHSKMSNKPNIKSGLLHHLSKIFFCLHELVFLLLSLLLSSSLHKLIKHLLIQIEMPTFRNSRIKLHFGSKLSNFQLCF